jgi:hypothetical protein
VISKQYSVVSSRNIGASNVNRVGVTAAADTATFAADTVTVEKGIITEVGVPFSIVRRRTVTGILSAVSSFCLKKRSSDVTNAPPGVSITNVCASGYIELTVCVAVDICADVRETLLIFLTE